MREIKKRERKKIHKQFRLANFNELKIYISNPNNIEWNDRSILFCKLIINNTVLSREIVTSKCRGFSEVKRYALEVEQLENIEKVGIEIIKVVGECI